MRHPTEGTLRRVLDEPAGVSDADREHIARCSQCLSELSYIGEDAVLVHAALIAGRGTRREKAPAGSTVRTLAGGAGVTAHPGPAHTGPAHVPAHAVPAHAGPAHTGRITGDLATTDVDVEAGWRRLSAAGADTGSPRITAPRGRPSLRVLKRPLVAAVVVAAVLAGAGPPRPTAGCRSSGPNRSQWSISAPPIWSPCPI